MAMHAWHLIMACALVGFVTLWRIPNRKFSIIACFWSLPLVFDFVFGKDTVLLLLILAVVMRMYKKRPGLAGFVMSLWSIKYHLFFLLPLLIIRQSRWKIAAGFGFGAITIAVISFLAAGWNWPFQLLDLLSVQSRPQEFLMPNIRGLIAPLTDRILPELVLCAVVGVLTWRIVHRTDFAYGMASILIGSLLVSHHAALNDCALLIPALTIALQRLSGSATIVSAGLKWLCIWLLSPLPYVLNTFGPASGLLMKASLVSVLLLMYVEARGAGQNGPTEQTATNLRSVTEGVALVVEGGSCVGQTD
jgi:hypothetical protein